MKYVLKIYYFGLNSKPKFKEEKEFSKKEDLDKYLNEIENKLEYKECYTEIVRENS